jgi:hypothetical protein
MKTIALEGLQEVGKGNTPKTDTNIIEHSIEIKNIMITNAELYRQKNLIISSVNARVNVTMSFL